MRKFKKRKKYNIFIIILLIIINVIVLLKYFDLHISNKLIDITTSSIETYNNHLIMDFISNDLLSKSDLNKTINIVKNSKDEIVSVNFDTKKSYEILKLITDEIYNIVSKTSYKDILDYDLEIKDNLILYYPIMLSSTNVYLNNLGPKIPIKVKFLSSLITNLNTKISSYGINNVLLELYVNIKIEDNIVIPFKKETINNNYDVLLSSSVIVGTIPSFLGTTIENNSPILQK